MTAKFPDILPVEKIISARAAARQVLIVVLDLFVVKVVADLGVVVKIQIVPTTEGVLTISAFQYHCRRQCDSDSDCLTAYEVCCKNVTTDPFPFCVPRLGSTKCCKDNDDCANQSINETCCYGICTRAICN